jgi:hypothetical protein
MGPTIKLQMNSLLGGWVQGRERSVGPAGSPRPGAPSIPSNTRLMDTGNIPHFKRNKGETPSSRHCKAPSWTPFAVDMPGCAWPVAARRSLALQQRQHPGIFQSCATPGNVSIKKEDRIFKPILFVPLFDPNGNDYILVSVLD